MIHRHNNKENEILADIQRLQKQIDDLEAKISPLLNNWAKKACPVKEGQTIEENKLSLKYEGYPVQVVKIRGEMSRTSKDEVPVLQWLCDLVTLRKNGKPSRVEYTVSQRDYSIYQALMRR
ncbi:MAG TPA: hypothetical protein DDX98_01185 [Bacteroidales bacterium]|jgi:hypothetical protein|nr:hypothetical protein [Bacteroidales bacterium]